MIIRPGEGRSEAPSTATERGRRSGVRSSARGAAGTSESAIAGPPRGLALSGGTGAWRRAAPRGLDVLQPVSGGVAVEVERPVLRVLATAEPFVRCLREHLHHVGVDAAMPLDDLARPLPSPAFVDEAIQLLDVQATQLGRPWLAAEHARAVLLPIHDVAERVLHGPGIAARRARHQLLPVRRAESSHDTVELGILASRSSDDSPARMSHVASILSQRTCLAPARGHGWRRLTARRTRRARPSGRPRALRGRARWRQPARRAS